MGIYRDGWRRKLLLYNIEICFCILYIKENVKFWFFFIILIDKNFISNKIGIFKILKKMLMIVVFINCFNDYRFLVDKYLVVVLRGVFVFFLMVEENILLVKYF